MWLKPVFALLVCGLHEIAMADPVVIVHPKCDSIGDIGLVRRVFLGKEHSMCNGKSVKPLDVDESNPLRSVFLTQVVGKNESQLRQYWSRQIFQRQGTPPSRIGDDVAVKSWVASNDDAIGVIDSKLLDDSVKVLLKLPE